MYFIAIILPPEICDAITEFKKDIGDRFQSKAALKLIPHITLKAPFTPPIAEREQVVQWFQTMIVSVPPFQQQLQDFGAFRNRRNPVIYVKPVINASLQRLQKEVVENFMGAYPGEQVTRSETEFHPHVTIAYRDLSPAMFKKAWPEYRSEKYEAGFEVKSFDLMQHDGRMWNSISNFLLAQSV